MRADHPDTPSGHEGRIGRVRFAADVTLVEVGGQPVRLSDLWRQRITVFLFLRHFG